MTAKRGAVGRLRAIGVIRSDLKTRKGAPRQGSEGALDVWLEVRAFAAPALAGIAVGDELLVITWLHQARRDVLKVHPRGNLKNPLTGVFATRSPDRPNPLGLHAVTVRLVEKNRLRIGPIEAIDGTPVLDIKPVLACSGNSGVPAGNFSEWLHDTEASLRSGEGGADVPCGTCNACCRSSLFIHIRPEEERTIRRIPRTVLFDAPGFPDGHLMMGFDDHGHCHMLVDNRCSIYEDRPRTCREYDCRVFATTGIPVDRPAEADIAKRVGEWVFQYDSEESREELQMLREAAHFLQTKKDLFPWGSLPSHPGELAVLAIRVYRLFAGKTRQTELVTNILNAMPNN